ncbi:hypothetical protein J2T17_004362 [Paenibacillus mucilaginosus]|uniref:S-layer homology domain-containing protein n=1 Tax=Paenibacillus mucilaginosus TaxID=61624 RepID=UPI003D1D0249
MKNKITKVTAAVLSLLLMSGCTEDITKAAGPVQLKDIDQHWSKDAVVTAVQKGYVDGYEDGTFRPNLNVSRAEFVKMIVIAHGLPVEKLAEGDSWYTPYINAAVKAGIHRWSDFTSGDWNTPISRLEMARIAFRASDATFQRPEVRIGDDAIMYNSTKKGLIQGLDKGELAPENPTTRGQSVTIIERTIKAKAGEKLEVDKYAVGNAELEFRGTNFETVLGRASSLTFPIEHALAGDSKIKIQQIIAIDTSDKQSPYYYLIENSKRADEKSFDGNYVIAFKVQYLIGSSPRQSSVRVADFFNVTWWMEVSSPNTRGFFKKWESGTMDDYLMFAGDKVNYAQSEANIFYNVASEKRSVPILKE